MRKKINYEKVTFLGGFWGEPPKSLQLLCSNLYLPCIFCMLTFCAYFNQTQRGLYQHISRNRHDKRARTRAKCTWEPVECVLSVPRPGRT